MGWLAECVHALLRACVLACRSGMVFARSFSSLTSFSPWLSGSANRMADVGTRRVKFLAVTSALCAAFSARIWLGLPPLPRVRVDIDADKLINGGTRRPSRSPGLIGGQERRKLEVLTGSSRKNACFPRELISSPSSSSFFPG